MAESGKADLLAQLLRCGAITEADIARTLDGFWVFKKSLASILMHAGIMELPGSDGKDMVCRYFFDDWYLYGIERNSDMVCSLLKLREQEHDLSQGLYADGDTPGVTVSFISFQTENLLRCLADPTWKNRTALGMEINRVVAYPGQKHHPALKKYFICPEAEGPYMVAELYIRHIASFASHGSLPVPDEYIRISKNRHKSKGASRVADFIDQNNAAAGKMVCDHKMIYLSNTDNLTIQEKKAILATHTGNVSVHSFAAEIRFHALFLVWIARCPIPFLGRSPYASAVRADLSIADQEFQGPTPYYNLNSPLVRKQKQFHKET